METDKKVEFLSLLITDEETAETYARDESKYARMAAARAGYFLEELLMDDDVDVRYEVCMAFERKKKKKEEEANE